MLRATVVVTSACLGIVSFGGVTGHAQVTQSSKVVVAPQASIASVSVMQNVDFAPFTLRPVKRRAPALRLLIPLDRFAQPSRSTRQEFTRDRRNALLPAPSPAVLADSFRADSSARTSKAIGVTATTRACVGS